MAGDLRGTDGRHLENVEKSLKKRLGLKGALDVG